jgi:hypothetical protein
MKTFKKICFITVQNRRIGSIGFKLGEHIRHNEDSNQNWPSDHIDFASKI